LRKRFVVERYLSILKFYVGVCMINSYDAKLKDADSRYAKSKAIAKHAVEHIAGGVVSLNRKVDPPIVFIKAQGSKLFDADGNEYIDYHAAFGPYLLGHNNPDVNLAVVEAIEKSWSLMGSGPTTWENHLANMLCEVVPSLELVQLTNTGSEATAHAIRLSRAWTGREDIILTLGGYNGWHNEVAREVMSNIDKVGPKVSPGEYLFRPLSAGIPESTIRRVHVVNFNDIDSVEYIMQRYPIACLMTEPVLQNIGVVPPQPGYLQGLRDLCDQFGSVLIFDEVKTGFRSALGGYQSVARVTPDISVFGKAIANGYPMGVIGGKSEIMELFDNPDPARRVLIAGTYNGHPIATAAAIATLEILQANRDHVYKQLEILATRLQSGLEQIYTERGRVATISRNGSAFCTYFSDHIPIDWHDLVTSHDFSLDSRYRRALIDHGVYHFPLPCKQGSISLAHTEYDIDRTIDVTREVLAEL
jgi:glutamate-1-semialdehyde 2,1-aminomutase